MVAANLGIAIYGLISDGALLSAESAVQETYVETVVAVVLGLLLIWLAHAYGDFTAWRAREAEPVTLRALGHAMGHDAAILIGGAIPLLAVLVSWAAGASLDSGVSAGVWTAVGAIVLVEVITALRSRLRGRDLLVQISLGAMLGLLVLGLRLTLHH